MGVPEEIRRVERPRNTVVVENKTDGPRKYAVRERKGVKYVSGSNPQPINGNVIGYIIDGAFVPLQAETACDGPEELSYGSSALFARHAADILETLLAVYPAEDAYSMIASVGVRVIRPGASYNRVSQHHRRTYLSVFYPAHVSKNHLSDLLERVGMDGDKRRKFFRLLMRRVAETHHVLIDGHLKRDGSTVNDLAQFSYKASKRGYREISVIYAYDLESREIVAGQVFPGNCLDAQAYRRFIEDNGITRGVIVTDKGFPPSKIRDLLGGNPALSHLTPLKNNSRLVATHGLMEFEGVLRGFDRRILYRKVQAGERWLYAFKDLSLVSEQTEAAVTRMENGKGFDRDRFERQYARAGFVVFESDLDLPPEDIYRAYDDRWEIELVFDQFNNGLEFDDTRVQGDFSVIGNEFLNVLAAIVSRRIMNEFRDKGVLDDMTYGDAMEDLSEVWRKVGAPKDARTDDGFWTRGQRKDMELMERLGLSEPAPKPPPKKRGRPRKIPEGDAVKRPRGRPKKNPQTETLVP